MDEFEKDFHKWLIDLVNEPTHFECASWARDWCNLESSKITALEKTTENISKMLNKVEAENQRLREALEFYAVDCKSCRCLGPCPAKQSLAETEGSD